MSGGSVVTVEVMMLVGFSTVRGCDACDAGQANTSAVPRISNAAINKNSRRAILRRVEISGIYMQVYHNSAVQVPSRSAHFTSTLGVKMCYH